MTGFINNNFLLGLMISKDRPKDEAIQTAITASQFGASNIVGTVMLKKQVDKVTEVEQKSTTLENEKTAITKKLNDQVEFIKKGKESGALVFGVNPTAGAEAKESLVKHNAYSFFEKEKMFTDVVASSDVEKMLNSIIRFLQDSNIVLGFKEGVSAEVKTKLQEEDGCLNLASMGFTIKESLQEVAPGK